MVTENGLWIKDEINEKKILLSQILLKMNICLKIS